MRWNVFSLEAVKEALKPKFVLEKVRYVTDDEEYGEGESTRLVFRNVEEMPEIDHIERTISTFFRDTYVHFKDKNIKPMRLWQDNLNESEDHIRYSTNHLVSPSLELIGETYISDESYTHKRNSIIKARNSLNCPIICRRLSPHRMSRIFLRVDFSFGRRNNLLSINFSIQELQRCDCRSWESTTHLLCF